MKSIILVVSVLAQISCARVADSAGGPMNSGGGAVAAHANYVETYCAWTDPMYSYKDWGTQPETEMQNDIGTPYYVGVLMTRRWLCHAATYPHHKCYVFIARPESNSHFRLLVDDQCLGGAI